MADKIVLTYFDIRARAELSRLIMAYGDIEYEDKRIEWKDWAEIKQTFPNGQLPLLEVNGVKLGQSMVIAHYLARRAGLTGKSEWEAAKAQNITQDVYETVTKFLAATKNSDEDSRPQKTEEFEEEILPKALQALEETLKKNGGEWFVGDELTWADICVADFLCDETAPRWRKDLPDFVKDKHPDLARHVDKVNSLPKIKSWMENRPKTTF